MGRMSKRIMSIGLATVLSIGFTMIQYIEYKGGRVDMSKRSTFYAATGLHGVHMIIGEVLLVVSVIREWLLFSVKRGVWSRVSNINMNFLDGCYITIVALEYA